MYKRVATDISQVEMAEDNEAMMKICKSGQTQKMRHLLRQHRVSIQFLIERFAADPMVGMLPTKTRDQAADIYTKRFTNPRLWALLLYVNGLVDPKHFWSAPTLEQYLQKTGIKPLRVYTGDPGAYGSLLT